MHEDNLVAPRRAFFSVSNKIGVRELAQALAGQGIELGSTGGTHKALSEVRLRVADVSEWTGFPEMMDGRVKTLHPGVHGGLLAVRSNPLHRAAMFTHNIKPIDLLVVNLYPFEETVKRGASFADCIENIDIGGPAMIRSAAKNHKDVEDYDVLLDELLEHNGKTTESFRKRMAAKAFARTAAYDAAIAAWFATKL
jgi:phosphoribosylaminoimidazolecarboxamide formyltransferase/IMP cyclohydrolase